MLTAALGVFMLLGGLGFAVAKGNPHAIACVIVAPILFAATVPIARRLAHAENDERYVAIIMSALVLHFAGALARYYVSFIVYKGNDAASTTSSAATSATSCGTGVFRAGSQVATPEPGSCTT